MHELSLCEHVIQLIEQQADEQQFRTVRAVWLEIGSLSGVEIEAMRFSFGVVAKESAADGAILHILSVQGLAHCPSCQQQTEVTTRYDICPRCGEYPLEILAGEEMRIKELEVQ
ncbi:MAG: hydrogenase maturation nickel metallochaperone HypA [Mariprofundales bacterium]|nr:hydrogenase maturation nickel metallochaperone HypA [Mariprofundales bacterium]